MNMRIMTKPIPFVLHNDAQKSLDISASVGQPRTQSSGDMGSSFLCGLWRKSAAQLARDKLKTIAGEEKELEALYRSIEKKQALAVVLERKKLVRAAEAALAASAAALPHNATALDDNTVASNATASPDAAAPPSEAAAPVTAAAPAELEGVVLERLSSPSTGESNFGGSRVG